MVVTRIDRNDPFLYSEIMRRFMSESFPSGALSTLTNVIPVVRSLLPPLVLLFLCSSPGAELLLLNRTILPLLVATTSSTL